jgi:hypothetical protein
MARLPFIVARDQPGLLEFLRRDFALEVVQGDVEIFIDRRTSRPGQVVQAYRAEGRDRPSGVHRGCAGDRPAGWPARHVVVADRPVPDRMAGSESVAPVREDQVVVDLGKRMN